MLTGGENAANISADNGPFAAAVSADAVAATVPPDPLALPQPHQPWLHHHARPCGADSVAAADHSGQQIGRAFGRNA